MLRTTVRVQRTPGFGEDVRRGLRKRMFDAADTGFATSFDEAPVGATGGLRLSGVQPTWSGDTIVWGYTAPYAADVEKGTDPHWVPIDDLRLWARRVLGDESAAGAVRHKISVHGTSPQPFVKKGFEDMRRFIRRHGLVGAIVEERGKRG